MVSVCDLLLVCYNYKMWSQSGILEIPLELDLNLPCSSGTSSVTLDRLFILLSVPVSLLYNGINL